MTHRKSFPANRGRMGFTLMELILVVAIMIALFAVGMLSLAKLRIELRQRELDSKAETIYVSVQSRMVALRAAGYEDKYAFSTANGTTWLTAELAPADYDASAEWKSGATLCYVSSEGGSAADALMAENTVDEELRGNHWYIEYNPESGSVYGVFYSETDAIPKDESDRDSLRYRKQRIAGGALVGYYGGDMTEINTTSTLFPSLEIENKEVLRATFYCNNPSPTEQLTFDITLSDGTNEYTKTVTHNELTRVTTTTYKYVWTLDSLKNDASRFYAQTEGKLNRGAPLTVTFTAKSTDTLVDEVKAGPVPTNGLFADSSTSDTAVIAYARHLQNLDRASHVTGTITNAQQVSDISFADDLNDDEDWYSLYGLTFTPIENDNLISYNGKTTAGDSDAYTSIKSLYIPNSTNGEAGLFATFAGEIRNVTLTGTYIVQGSNVGALIGHADGSTTIDNCRVYLSSSDGDLDNLAAEDMDKLAPQLSGQTVGGLIGRTSAAVKIEKSFASTVIKGTSVAGGLVGEVDGTLSATTVYADSYITAPQTGGLFGTAGSNAAITLNNFYAVGYQKAETAAAGIVPGAVDTATNGYAACAFEGSATTYSTASTINAATNVYYLTGSNHATNTEKVIYTELTENKKTDGSALLSTGFTTDSGSASHPYNLLGQGLTTYSYPRFDALDHYGDWQAEFESGALVYYEVYKESDGTFTYGFEGANVSALQDDKTVVGDGYAIAYSDADDMPETIKVDYNDGDGETIAKEYQTVTKKTSETDDETYYIVPLSKTIVNPDLSGSTGFYKQITIYGEGGSAATYYFNPYFAKSAVRSDSAPSAPENVYLRTARHLYGMSLYYSTFATDTSKSRFEQELDIDYTTYNWGDYYKAGTTEIESQSPIDSGDGFLAKYDGNEHTVTGISIESEKAATGLFGTVAENAEVRNVILVGRQDDTKNVHDTIGRSSSALSGSSKSSQIGAIAGVNRGTIRNCAASGYTTTYYGYNHNTVYIGGLVGENRGTIRNCSADAAGITLSGYNNSVAYAGGFVGQNSGSITACYATGCISVLYSQNTTVQIAGFAGSNTNGTVRRCYAATALTAAGEAEVYGFTKLGGTVADCSYLDGGTYSYAGKLYAYNTSANEYAGSAAGKGTALEQSMSGFAAAAVSYNHAKTGTETDNYPYPAVVTRNGETVHYGNWPVKEDIGTVGIFYWEHEENGGNSGYHLSYIGMNNGTKFSADTLCTQHDDGGVITEYGYGYFYSGDEPTLSHENTNLGNENTKAGEELKKQMPDYTFVAYTTGEGDSNLHTTGFVQNSKWTLTSDSVEYTYTVSPFFGDAMSLDSYTIGGNTTTTNATKPGKRNDDVTKNNEYQIRSTAQLQFINWNSYKQKAAYSITSNTYSDESDVQATRTVTETTYDRWGRPTTTTKTKTYYIPARNYYPYLLSGDPDSTPTKSLDLYWVQTHDVDSYAENGGKTVDFTPIGSFYDIGGDNSEAKAYLAYFPYSFDGQAYAIRNIEIHTANQAVGLFGVTSGAQLQNIVMYSDRGNEIEATNGGNNWYTMGGLVGLAGSAKSSATDTTDSDSYFKNCTVSGYTIIDSRSKDPGWGGGCVGGLVGMTNMDIESCTAVNDIKLQPTYNQGWENLRVGGIAGVARATINSCYAGGSIVSNATGDDSGNYSTMCIWVGGIAGGIVVRNTGNLGNLVGFCDRSLIVANCYSYVDMPKGQTSLGQTGFNHVRASMSIASNGEMLDSAFDKGPVPARTVRIYNCYALEDKVKGTTDYKNYWNNPSWNGKDLNALDTNSNKDNVYIYNSSTPYLSYDEMESLTNKLNSTVTTKYDYGSNNGNTTVSCTGAFSTVTTTEKEQTINGKYSFPGNDTELSGLNYPFPTVLTQTDAFGSAVNVHYGAWPKNGMYWENSSTRLDLYANRDNSVDQSAAFVDVRIYFYGVDNVGTITKDDITFTDVDGTPFAEGTTAPAEVYSVGTVTTDDTGTYVTVTFKGLHTGKTRVTAKIEDDLSAQTLLDVTNEMTLKVVNEGDGDTETTVTLNPGEEKTVTLRLYATDKDGNEVGIAPASDKITLKKVETAGEQGKYVIVPETATYSNGEFTVGITGAVLDSLTDGDDTVTVTVTYQYGSTESESMTATAGIVTTTKAPDFAVLKYGDSTSGYRFDTDGKKTNGAAEIAKALTDGNGIYLRNKLGTEFSTIDMSAVTLTVDGNDYKPDADGIVKRTVTPTEEGGATEETLATITLGNVKTKDNYTYYSITVDDYSQTTDATLSITVKDGVTLTAIVPGVKQTTPAEGGDAQTVSAASVAADIAAEKAAETKAESKAESTADSVSEQPTETKPDTTGESTPESESESISDTPDSTPDTTESTVSGPDPALVPENKENGSGSEDTSPDDTPAGDGDTGSNDDSSEDSEDADESSNAERA